MNRKLVSGITLTLLLISMLTLAFNIRPVKASITIYIRADGSIDPPTAPISSLDNVTYTFTHSINNSIIVERNNIVVDGADYTLQGEGEFGSIGISLPGRSNVTIRNMEVRAFCHGIWLSGSSNNIICGNNITNNNWSGIGLDSSSGNSLSRNNITNNVWGIWLRYYSGNNNISGNNITNSYTHGICLDISSGNNISGNNITNTHGDGIMLNSSNNNNISGNNITNNGEGIFPVLCSSNMICYNNFVDNNVQVTGYAYPSTNVWDDGYPSGGNYWSDYTGIDTYSGPYQNEIGSDGIGDTPYVIDENNRDRYPLMNPWTPIETSVKVKGKSYPVTIVSNTTIDQMVIKENFLQFRSSGPTGEKGYILVIFPMVNSTSIRVKIDNDWLTPPPFPVINTNGTHYFIYFEFTLSTHSITIQFAPPPIVNATTDIDPDTLNLCSKGNWITGYIELPEGYDVNDINVSTVVLNDTVPAELHPTEVGDYDNDTVPDLMVKFNRIQVAEYILSKGIMTGNVTLTISGYLIDGTMFEGSDIIRVRMPGDINIDGKVDIKDIFLAIKAFGSFPEYPRWNPIADENEDNKIDIKDIFLILKNFGKTYP